MEATAKTVETARETTTVCDPRTGFDKKVRHWAYYVRDAEGNLVRHDGGFASKREAQEAGESAARR